MRCGEKEKRKRLSKRTVIVFKKPVKGKKQCALCKERLLGTKTLAKERKASKSEKRPSRIFGGILCTKCTSYVLNEAVKVKEGVKELSAVKLSVKNYAENALQKMKE